MAIDAMEVTMWNCQPTLEELLADPMMEPVLQQSRMSEREIRKLLAAAAARRGRSPEPLSEATG
jgi:hypothetical protein